MKAEELGAQRVCLEVERANTRAKKLYDALGFRDHGRGRKDRQRLLQLGRRLELLAIEPAVLADVRLVAHGHRLGLDWSRYASVALGWSFNEVSCHHIANSQFHTINTALVACRDRGRRTNRALTLP